MTQMDDQILFTVASELNRLTNLYTSGQLKHHQYVADYDKTLERYKTSKKQLVQELAKRRNKKV